MRTPPHDTEAERSLLGAMLLSRDAVIVAGERLSENSFYSPAHAKIYGAIRVLVDQNQPVDPVTVSDELRRHDALESVGGPAALLKLQCDTPSTGSASRYAEIIERNALLRQMIGAASEIAELGYTSSGSAADVLDHAESMIYKVSQQRSVSADFDMHAALAETIADLEKNQGRTGVSGTPSGFTDLDAILGGFQPGTLNILGARPAQGKMLELDTPLPTPGGWTTMKDVQVGDRLFDEAGKPCNVTAISDIKHDRPCHKITFDDGSTIVADAEHEWFAYDFPAWKSARERHRRAVTRDPNNPNLIYANDQSSRFKHPRVVTTQQMLDEGLCGPGGKRPNWYIQLTQPLEYPEAKLPVDPYIFGRWLADGATAQSYMAIGDHDIEHDTEQFYAAGYCLRHVNQRYDYGTTPNGVGRCLHGDGQHGPWRSLTRELRSVGLLGKAKKHIPAIYMRASVEQRLAVLQGMMDGDGYLESRGVSVGLTLSNKHLAEQVRELAISLGHKVNPLHLKVVKLPDGRTGDAWRFSWTPLHVPFRMKRYLDTYKPTGRAFGVNTRRAIKSIERVPSVPMKCVMVDSPNHLYLAGESMIPTHNSALALSIAHHASVEQNFPVLFFSLEMSVKELMQRLLSMDARVDSSRMRFGNLHDIDWERIAESVSRMKGAPIIVDDNANISIGEIRGKARRAVQKFGGLGLVVVDYVQLMHGRSSAESRQIEVAEISRGLKLLAKETNCPVLALAQLNRGLEQRMDKRPMLSDLRESGCLPASAEILRADTNQTVTIGELAEQGDCDVPVWAVNERGKIEARTLFRAFPTGRKMVCRMTTMLGRTVELTANHPVLTPFGFTPVGELNEGDPVGLLSRVPEPLEVTGDEWSYDDLAFTAHMIGDGSMLAHHACQYTSADPECLDLVEKLAQKLLDARTRRDTSRQRADGGWTQLFIASKYQPSKRRYSVARRYFEPKGLWDHRGPTKRVPRSILSLDGGRIAHFLHHLWATDGTVGTTSSNGKSKAFAMYSTASRGLANDVSFLLARLGIRSRIGVAREYTDRDGYMVTVDSKTHQQRFFDLVGCFGEKGHRIPECVRLLGDSRGRSESLPEAFWFLAEKEFSAAGQRLGQFGEISGTNKRYGEGGVTRSRLLAAGKAIESEPLVDAATSHIRWDKIRSVEPIGEQDVFDATVEGLHNFTVDGIVLHNSLEADADTVMFIYRDELYNPDSIDKGMAEVLIAKHRAGPTGMVKLAYLSHYTRFADMYREA